MSRGFVVLDNPSHHGKTCVWLTPLALIRALGVFDFDPCAHPGHKTARYMNCLPTNGLEITWKGRVWLNPPYGKQTGAWLERLAKHGHGSCLIGWGEPFNQEWKSNLNGILLVRLGGEK